MGNPNSNYIVKKVIHSKPVLGPILSDDLFSFNDFNDPLNMDKEIQENLSH